MSCDRCGCDDAECECALWALYKRVDELEEELHKLTFIVNAIHLHITKEKK